MNYMLRKAFSFSQFLLQLLILMTVHNAATPRSVQCSAGFFEGTSIMNTCGCGARNSNPCVSGRCRLDTSAGTSMYALLVSVDLLSFFTGGKWCLPLVLHDIVERTYSVHLVRLVSTLRWLIRSPVPPLFSPLVLETAVTSRNPFTLLIWSARSN